MYKNRHETEEIVIKSAKVDKKIVPVVNWLNTYRNTFTIFSCEGDPCAGDIPYVMFFCWDNDSLTKIVEKLRDFAWSRERTYSQDGDLVYRGLPTIEINFHERNMVRYTVEFPDLTLEEFIEYLERKKK